MRPTLPVLALAGLVAAAPFAAAKDTVGGAEISTFVAPSLGSDFDGHTGIGISGALTATYEPGDGKYDEFFVGQIEGLYMHSEGTNSIGGASHKEKLDAGFGFINLGLGGAYKDWSFCVLAGMGVGGGSLSGDTALDDLAMDTAFQVKPRVTWNFARNWSLFAEYRFLRSASVVGEIFSDKDDRALSMHALGFGVGYTF